MSEKEQRIAELQRQHDLPTGILDQCVSDDGTIDEGKLQIAVAAAAWGRTPAASGDPGLVQALSDSYWQAMDKKDVVAMMSLKDALAKIGATLLPKK
jgi:hypothetical protein